MMNQTVLSFYVDDTNPHVAPPSAFKTFLDFVASEGVAGESSLIIGYDWAGHAGLSQPTAENDAYIAQVQRAYACGIDTHCELYTHMGCFDFNQRRIPDGVIHEGVWLYEPGVSVAEYESYFANILTDGDQLGVHFTGLTWPGCGCPACRTRYDTLAAQGVHDPNPNLWQALLNLSQAGRFRGRSVPCFFGDDLEVAEAHLEAGRDGFGVFTLPPNTADRLGAWFNAPQYAVPDYYISADGQKGRIVELVRAQAEYCLFYAHWQGLNPANGVGWEAFTQVVQRVQRHLRDEVVWMRPSQYTDSLLFS